MNTLIFLICGMIRTGKSHLHEVGSELPGLIDLESRVKRVKRWLTNKYTGWEVHFLPFVHAVLARQMALSKELVFAIDGSEVGNGCTGLMISLVVGKRAIPVCWLVRECKKGHLPASMHLELFEQLHQLLEGYEKVVVLGDGEFDNHQVMDACQGWNWHFVFRTAKNTKIFDGRDEFAIGELYPPQGHRCWCIAEVQYTKKRYGPVHATVWHKPKHHDPIYLLSNFEFGLDTLRYYEKRWSIETFFKDIKSNGFNIHKSKLADKQRVSKLLLIACLAYILLFKMGQQEQNSIFIAKVTRKDRMDLSIFMLGKRLVLFACKHHLKITFSFSHKCSISNR